MIRDFFLYAGSYFVAFMVYDALGLAWRSMSARRRAARAERDAHGKGTEAAPQGAADTEARR